MGCDSLARMRDVVVLCYHALSDDWPAALAVRPERFERQLDLMLERGYEGETFTRAVLGPRARRSLVVTFDDGFRSVLDRALPVMERLGVPGTLFAVTRFAARGDSLSWDGVDHWREGRYADQLASMSWDDLRGLADAGWEVGSPTRSHPRLTTLSDERLADELGSSRAECAEAMGRCDAIAYPYGDVDPRVAAAAAAVGYRAGAALPGRFHAERTLEWPRIGVYWNDDLRRFKLKVSRVVRMARTLARR
jgi:peptidoglycan/xylan/chitin deacetylase (PgdA/CDA1 family)